MINHRSSGACSDVTLFGTLTMLNFAHTMFRCGACFLCWGVNGGGIQDAAMRVLTGCPGPPHLLGPWGTACRHVVVEWPPLMSLMSDRPLFYNTISTLKSKKAGTPWT